MHRLFVAIRPPRRVRDALTGLMGGVAGARWRSDDQLHLTLRFIGEVDRHQAEDANAALGAIHHPAFEIALAGVNGFDRRGAPTALWAGVTPQAPLETLHKKVEQALAAVGIAPECRAFLPHVTLAYLPRGAGNIGGFLEAAGRLSTPPFAVDSFALLESRLLSDGALYREVETYPLDRPRSPRQSHQE